MPIKMNLAGKWINVFNKETQELDFSYFDDLEREFWEWNKCFNCDFCWDVSSETWRNKDAVVECLGMQSGINFLKLWDSCPNYKIKEDYYDILLKLKSWN